jgi:hypothetical protein
MIWLRPVGSIFTGGIFIGSIFNGSILPGSIHQKPVGGDVDHDGFREQTIDSEES